MTVHQELAKISPPRDTVLTIGTFDGVHLGHQQLLQRLKALADSSGLLAAVLTFRNHPRLVLNSELELSYITTLEDRLDLLRGQGIDLVISVDFTRDLSLLGAREFVGLLCGHLKMKSLVVGPDFALGHGREGDISTLMHLGEEMGFRVQAIGPTMTEGDVVKSSKTRGLIAQGDVETASRMLGRWYALTGLVVEGDRRGRLLGFPTANLSLDPSIVIPADGIYATWVVVDGRRYQGATCIGLRPTFGVNGRTVETFILDFQGDIYGKPITLEFAGRLRDEQAFPNVEALVEQMKIDVAQTRAVLSTSG
jgi:riboflavin kinase/FMN adenylyltransferase